MLNLSTTILRCIHCTTLIRLFDARHMGRRREPRIPRPAHGLRLITAQDMGANLDAKVCVHAIVITATALYCLSDGFLESLLAKTYICD
jgi:hypothetical protein